MRLTRKTKASFKNKKSETAIYGDDPALLGPKFDQSKQLHHAFSWYSYMHRPDEGRKWIEEYMKAHPKEFSKSFITSFKRVPWQYIPMTACTIARLLNHKCPLSDVHLEFLHARLEEVTERYAQVIPDEEKATFTTKRQNGVILAFEQHLDDFYNNGYETTVDVYKELQHTAPKQNEVQEALAYYKPLRDELRSTDKQCIEAYKRLSKKRKANYIAFLESIVTEFSRFVRNTKQERKINRLPRAKKVKPAGKVVARMKFKVSDPQLKLVSIDPATILGANALWTYNTKYSRLAYIEANEGGFSVKGTTLLNVNEKASYQKRLRKPADTLNKLLNSGRVTMKSVLADLSTKSAPVNGRINKETILLKAFK